MTPPGPGPAIGRPSPSIESEAVGPMEASIGTGGPLPGMGGEGRAPAV